MSSSILQVDRYVLCEPIAVGGMATVYFARQRGAAGFSKAVAIKRMRPDLVHQREFVDLFVDEARLASRVRHANVVSVIDVVASGDELLLVMEYFHGESLARLVTTCRNTKTQIPPPIAIAIACNVLHGLHAAHEAKGEKAEALHIVHRDVSPQNVLIGVDGIARVADFGIARAAGQIHATDEGKTRGKAGYSAPEQLRGGAVTRKIDLFAASALLWELLVGRRLFDGESQAAVVTAVLTEPIEPPGLHVPELPEELDDLIMRGLDRDPKRRPETALELATALERVIPPASPPTVAAWMMGIAREDLDKREEIVRRIESGLFDTPAESTSTIPPSEPGGTLGSLATSRSPSAAPPPSLTQPRAVRSRVAQILAGALGVAIVIGVVLLIVSSRASSPNTNSSANAAPPTAPTTPVVLLPPSTSASAVEVPTSAPSTIASAPPPRPSSIRTSTTPPPRPKSKRCDPPYDLDPAGRKIFRVECL